ncbi:MULTISPECIES: phosphate ABC transporter permease PstA [unclassified Microbacterium]|uniref:phosphate ABC transporter permease PstA n=1 Tax=unclassified Microbacterium TaxID=2609290 RepID=UPI00214AB6AC|nr:MULTISPECIES: phosphate ABC transporter permease PstA [unclassified Microbacterium]MCR2784039.1 phosphate ABC transporter permease PstA [Microbacterium sp. zg.B96]MDL5351043.1 phosphate ABC transporter permease PstA [Microbacterium sp. zg-YB36]WIM15121.1 phosphate ABC transporter permease PstA [Microbacterium sp. zg-B96]
MTVTTAPAPAPAPPKTDADSMRLTSGRLPRWAPWVLLAVSAATVALLFGVITLAAGTAFNIAGWAIVSALVYLALITTISSVIEGRRKGVDRLVTGVVTVAFLIAMVPLVSVAITVLTNGIAGLSAEFFTHSMRNVVGEGGGALHAIVGTLLMTLAAAIISIPIGLFTAIYLIEYGADRRLARGITFLVDVMTGIPSIVAGLFAFALFALFFGPGVRLGIMGAVALSVLMIPVVVRSTEEMLRLVPNELREAAYALGVPKWLTIVKVVLPTSIAGITTGIMLSISRVIGETAPLLITAGMATSMNYNLFEGRMASLPVFVYTQYMNQGIPSWAYLDRAWAGALVLIVIVMVLNLVARLVARIFAPKMGR